MDSIVTVTGTPAANRRLTLPATLRAELGIDPDAASDERLGALIDRASAGIETYLDRALALESVSEQFRLDWCVSVLPLSRFPVTTVASVTEAGSTVANEDRELDPASGRMWRLSGDALSSWAAGKIVVAYTAGYVLPGEEGRTLPHPIEAAALKLAGGLWHAAARDPLVKGEAVDGVIRQDYWVGGVGEGLPPDVCALLNPWRRVWL